MRKITQFIVDTYIDDLDEEDYRGSAVPGCGVHVVEVIDDNTIVVKGKQGMYVVSDYCTDDEFVMRLIERVERHVYDRDGEDVKEIIEL